MHTTPGLAFFFVFEGVGNGCWHRSRRFYQAENRHDEQEVREGIEREDSAEQQGVALRRLGAEISKGNAIEYQGPEEPEVDRPVLGGPDARCVEPRNEKEHDERTEHCD